MFHPPDVFHTLLQWEMGANLHKQTLLLIQTSSLTSHGSGSHHAQWKKHTLMLAWGWQLSSCIHLLSMTEEPYFFNLPAAFSAQVWSVAAQRMLATFPVFWNKQKYLVIFFTASKMEIWLVLVIFYGIATVQGNKKIKGFTWLLAWKSQITLWKLGDGTQILWVQ